jgi:hypothetical protein
MPSQTDLNERYPLYLTILDSLGSSKYGKAYVHCIKYRIIEAVEKNYGERYRNDIIKWTRERPNSWRNTSHRCSKAVSALVILGERSSKGGLTSDQDHIYQIFKLLLSGNWRTISPLHRLTSIFQVLYNFSNPSHPVKLLLTDLGQIGRA